MDEYMHTVGVDRSQYTQSHVLHSGYAFGGKLAIPFQRKAQE